MIEEINSINCTGCKMCADLCPNQAISYRSDKKGFWYPQVDPDQCSKCRLCMDTCPGLSHTDHKKHNPEVYSVWLKDEDKRKISTSGGAYYALAEQYVCDGKYIVGCQYTDNNKGAYHVVTNSEKGMEKVIGSKYFQSDTAGIYQNVKCLLDSGEEVLFCGTPCQSAALQNYLGKPYSNLVTIDFICRGVTSPKVYRDYISELEGRLHSKVRSVHMKNKRAGWHSLGILIKFQNGKEYFRLGKKDLWVRGFIQESLYTRPACFHCKYKSLPRVSDISLGDFWGIQEVRKEELFKGISLVMINSEKGKDLFHKIRNEVYCEKRSFDEALKGNPSILINDCIGAKSDMFFKMSENMSVSRSIKKCLRNSGKHEKTNHFYKKREGHYEGGISQDRCFFNNH